MTAQIANKDVLVLARRDHTEAMRVAAGLTIFGHRVQLVFMDRPVADDDANREQAEMLELADIVPRTTVAGDQELARISPQDLAGLIASVDHVLNV